MLHQDNSAIVTHVCQPTNFYSRVLEHKATDTEADKPEAWPAAKRRATDYGPQHITIRRRSTSLSNSKPTTIIDTGIECNPTVPTHNRYRIFSDCLLRDDEADNAHEESCDSNTFPANLSSPSNTKPPPIYLHGNINHNKLLKALKTSYGDRFHIKYVSQKLKFLFQKIEDFTNFKDVC